MDRTAIALVALAIGLVATPAWTQGFVIGFDWAGLRPCTSGRPNVVPNPRFRVSGLPKGTAYIRFTLKDLDAPSYVHGGGWVKISHDGRVPAHAFSYKSPCPPAGPHRYRWTAEASDRMGDGAMLGQAMAERDYPR